MEVTPGERAVTIAGPQRTVDLRVPAGVPIADLLPQLARTVGAPCGGSGWDLVPVGSPALLLDATLATAAVGDGDVLHLRVQQPERRAPHSRSVRDRMASPRTPDDRGSPGWIDLVDAVMAAALTVPLLVAVAVELTASVDGVRLWLPSVAFVLGAVLLTMLGGWVAVRDLRRRPKPGSVGVTRTSMRHVVSTVAGASGIAWAGVAGGALVSLVAPTVSAPALAAGVAVSALGAAVVGGGWAARRGPAPAGWTAGSCGAYGLLAAMAAGLIAAPLGWDAALRLIAIGSALTVGALPGLAVTAGGATRLDRLAAGTGVTAAAADDTAERAAAVLRGALTGAVLVAMLALVSRWPEAGPVDLVTVGATSALFALRARTIGSHFAAVPTAGAVMAAVLVIVFATREMPVDRLLVTLAAVVAVFGAVRVGLEHRRPQSPAAAAYGTRLARWGERALIVLIVPLASGVVDGLLPPWAGR